jgi:YaiO family outer membrane protein
MKPTAFKSFFALLMICLLSVAAHTAEISFDAAREAAFNGRRAEAIEICKAIIAKDPEAYETRTLLGRVYAWEDQYEKAREQFNYVLKAKPDSADARAGLNDVEIWEGRSRKTLYKAVLAYTHDELTQNFDPWDLASLSLSRQFNFGSVIARMNRANRFDTDGTQFEVDAYPHLRDGTYFYLNAGFSSDSIFAQRRYGIEGYQSLGDGYEGSLGFRYLQFTNSIVRIFTGTIGKYLGNYFLLFRLNGVPDPSGTSFSGRFQLRKYSGDENYIQVAVGAGRSPTFASTAGDVVVLRSTSASVDGYRLIAPLLYGSAGIGYSHDEIRASVFRGDWSFSLGLEKRF